MNGIHDKADTLISGINFPKWDGYSMVNVEVRLSDA
jgi:hypothetical protein